MCGRTGRSGIRPPDAAGGSRWGGGSAPRTLWEPLGVGGIRRVPSTDPGLPLAPGRPRQPQAVAAGVAAGWLRRVDAVGRRRSFPPLPPPLPRAPQGHSL